MSRLKRAATRNLRDIQMKVGDRITFSGNYTVYDPSTKQTRIELNIILRSGITTKIEEDSMEVFSNDEFCYLPKSNDSCAVHHITSL